MRLGAVLLFGVAVAAFGFWLATAAITLIGAWLVGFAFGVFMTAYAVTHQKDVEFMQEMKDLIRKL